MQNGKNARTTSTILCKWNTRSAGDILTLRREHITHVENLLVRQKIRRVIEEQEYV